MKPSLRWLIWLALLVGGWSVTLDWQDELNKLRPERERIERSRQREKHAASAIDWESLSRQAGEAQLAWLNRLPAVSQMGVFRAEAMEAMADLCKRQEAACQVAAMGETSTSRVQAPGNNPQAGSPSDAKEPQGMVSTSVRVTASLDNKLMPLLRAVEEGPVLREVEKFTVRSGRADFIVKTFGLDSRTATVLKAAAERQSAEGKAAASAPSMASQGAR